MFDYRSGRGFGGRQGHLALATVAASTTPDAAVVRAGVLGAVDANVGRRFAANTTNECRGFGHWFFSLLAGVF